MKNVNGKNTVIFVTGSAGVGKSQLLSLLGSSANKITFTNDNQAYGEISLLFNDGESSVFVEVPAGTSSAEVASIATYLKKDAINIKSISISDM